METTTEFKVNLEMMETQLIIKDVYQIVVEKLMGGIAQEAQLHQRIFVLSNVVMDIFPLMNSEKMEILHLLMAEMEVAK